MEDKWRWLAVTAIAPAAWGSTYFVTREFLPADYPIYGAAIRALPAGLVLLAVARRRPHGSWWWKSLVLGALNMSAFFILVYVAAQLLPTSVASVVMAMSPVVMMGIAWGLLSERPGVMPALGAGLGITGVCVMVLTGEESINLLGVMASVAAMTISSVGYVLTKKWGGDVPVLASTSWQLIAGGLLLLPVAAIVEGAPPVVDASAAAAFAYISLIATALAYVGWFTGLRHLSAGTVGLVGLLNPVTGVVLGTLVAGERPTVQQLVGIVLVLAGVVLGQKRARRRDVDLPKRFSNKRPALKSLIRRVLRSSERRRPRGRTPERHDTRSAVTKSPAKSQTRLTPEQRVELVADYEAGMPVRVIAAKYGVHRGTIPTIIRRAGAVVRLSGLSEEERERACSLYEGGMTLTQVAQSMGIGDETVRQAVVDKGGMIRPRGRRSCRSVDSLD